MDDVGIDQMRPFGYGGATPRDAQHRNHRQRRRALPQLWTMPECSPSRAMFFEGRYPLRTNVYDAILSVDLANSQVSPYETTTPKLLKQRGYKSGLFGKFHLTGSERQYHREPQQPAGLHAPCTSWAGTTSPAGRTAPRTRSTPGGGGGLAGANHAMPAA